MIAISTKYLGPTDHKGARIAASTCNGHRCVIPYPHDCSGELAHWQAAAALIKQEGWDGVFHCGGTKTGWVFVFEDDCVTYHIEEQ